MSCTFARTLGALLTSVGLTVSGSAIAIGEEPAAQSDAGDAVRLPPVPAYGSSIFAGSSPVTSSFATPSIKGPAIDIRPEPTLAEPGESAPWQGSLLARRLTNPASIVDDPANAAVQPVTWSALALAQRTVPQGYYAGADYLLIRPKMSEPVPFFSGSGNNGVININANTFAFDYQSAPRVFLGYRNAETGSALQFTYWHFQETANQGFTAGPQNSGFIPNAPMFLFLIGNGFQSNHGDSIGSQMKMQLNVYDVEFYKPMVLGGGRWLMTGSIGARILDYKQTIDTIAVDSGRTQTFSELNNLQFTGAGPRASFEARRIVGVNGALYVRGGYALLVGVRNAQVQMNTIDNSQQPPQPQFISINEGVSKTISNADFEVGGSWRFGDQMILSAGWMLAAFTDLSGMPGGLNLTDNSNILSFDGLVARAAFSW